MKALLLTSVPPCAHYTAGIVLRELICLAPANSVVNVTVVNPQLGDAVIDPNLEIPHLRLHRPLEHGIAYRRYMGKLIPKLSRLRELKRNSLLPELIQRTVNFARSQRVDRVWAHLETPYPIRMALPVAEELGVPLYTMVFDPPSWYLRSFLVDPVTFAEVIQSFDAAINSSQCCAVASEPMAQEYLKKYKTKIQVLLHCFDTTLAQPPLDKLPERDIFIIGMAGQIYAMDAWVALLGLLDAVKWRIKGRKVIIRYLGRYIALGANTPRHVEYLGWHGQAEAVRLLSECDLLYCPYPFNPAEEEVSRLSFPSKVPGYLAAGRPTLFHGPEYSSPAYFFRKTNSGLICTSLVKSVLYNEIERLFLEPELYGLLCDNAVNALKDHFSLEIMQHNFENFMDLPL
jgi:hypothetical protein